MTVNYRTHEADGVSGKWPHQWGRGRAITGAHDGERPQWQVDRAVDGLAGAHIELAAVTVADDDIAVEITF